MKERYVIAIVKCRNCGNSWKASFPQGSRETRLQCPLCQMQLSVVMKYVKRKSIRCFGHIS